MLDRFLDKLRGGQGNDDTGGNSTGAPGIGARLGVPEPDQARALVLYKFDSCPFCYRVMRSVEQLGLEIPMEDTRRDPDARKELYRKTGRTQVPCLFIDGEPLFESADIIDWLRVYKQKGARRPA